MTDQIILQPVKIDGKGNILLHGMDGMSLDLTFQDSAGAERDMTGRTVKFIVEDKVEVTLDTTSNPAVLKLLLPQTDLVTIGESVSKEASPLFVVVDVTDEPNNDVIWEGKIYIRGFTAP